VDAFCGATDDSGQEVGPRPRASDPVAQWRDEKYFSKFYLAVLSRVATKYPRIRV
jgi:hypothetical protein